MSAPAIDRPALGWESAGKNERGADPERKQGEAKKDKKDKKEKKENNEKEEKKEKAEKEKIEKGR